MHPAHQRPDEPEDDLATGRYEPCAGHRGIAVDGPCEGCGWLAGEHGPPLATVIPVPARPAAPLRRAS